MQGLTMQGSQLPHRPEQWVEIRLRGPTMLRESQPLAIYPNNKQRHKRSESVRDWHNLGFEFD